MRRFLAVCVGLVLAAGCSAPPPPAVPPPVKTVRILQQKVEIAEGLRRMAADYEKETPGVRLVIETYGGGQDFDAALADRYQAGTLPDVFMSQGAVSLDPWVAHAEDLTDQPWVADLQPGTADAVTRKGRILGAPLAVEGYGFLYNKALFRQAGIGRLPDTLSTLEAACRKLRAAGIVSFSNGYAEWWVLGVHNFNVLLGSVKDVDGFVGRLSGGEGPGPDAAAVEGWMRLLDLTARYGQPNPTSSGTYNASVAAFLAGQAAMIQQGNWIEPDLGKGVPGLEVGVLPMPVSEVPTNRLPMGVPNYWIVNRDSPVKAEAKEWLQWLHASPAGQRFLVNELKVIPPSVTLASAPVGPLSAPFAQAWRQGRTLPWVFPRFPDKTKSLAAAMRAYLEHPQSHAQFWRSLGRAWSQP